MSTPVPDGIAAVMATILSSLRASLTRLSPTVLAAQLTLDHVKCFAVDSPTRAVDARVSEEQYARDYGQQVQLPRPAVSGLELVGLRRCFCAEGPAAHALYRLNGQPVSLYVITGANRDRASADVFGHDAVIWSTENITYVLVSKEPGADVERLAVAMEGGL